MTNETKPDTTDVVKMLTIDDHLARLSQESARLDALRLEAQQKAESYGAQVDALARRVSTIQICRTQLAGLRSLEPEQKWRADLIAWRHALTNELLTLPARIADPHTLGTRRNLELSIHAIDVGPQVFQDSGWSLENSRLGKLLRSSGYVETGADLTHNRNGTLPWLASMPQIERRIADLQRQRADAQSRLDEALRADAHSDHHRVEVPT